MRCGSPSNCRRLIDRQYQSKGAVKMLIPFISAIANDQLMQDKKMLMLVVTATGLIVVFLALIILILIFSIFGAVAKYKKKDTGAKPPVITPPTPVVSGGSVGGASRSLPAGGVSEEIIAAISAAVAVTMDGKPFAIRSVKRAAQSGRNAWSNAGIIANTRPF